VHCASTLKMMDYTSDKTLFLSVGDDKSVWIWNATDVKSVVGTLVHEVEVDHARFSPDGKKVLTACVDGSLRIWDVATGSVILPRDDSDGSSKDRNSNDGSRDGEDDSIMNMLATVKSPAQRFSAAQRFFDHDGDEVPESKVVSCQARSICVTDSSYVLLQKQRSPISPRAKFEIASKPLAKCRGFFQTLVGKVVVGFKLRKERGAPTAEHNKAQTPTVRTKEIRTGRAKMRVFASGDKSVNRRRPRSPETDDEPPSPVRGERPRRAASVDSEYGCMGAICFCTCLPSGH